MFEKTRCKCPRCAASRRRRYLAASGVCLIFGLGYFAAADRPEAVPDISSEGITEPAKEPISDWRPIAVEDLGPVATQTARTDAQGSTFETGIVDDRREFSVEPASSPVTTESGDLNAREVAVTSLDESLSMAYSSDPFGLLPTWLTGDGPKILRLSRLASADENASVAHERENAILESQPSAQEPSKDSVPEPKSDASETAEPARERDSEPLRTDGVASADAPESGNTTFPTDTSVPTPAIEPPPAENKSLSFAGTSAPAWKSSVPGVGIVSPPVIGTVSAPEPTVQHPNTVEPVARSTPKPEPASENKATFQIAANASKRSQPKSRETWANFVATQGDDLLRSAPPQDRRLPQGYITVESKPESLREPTAPNRPSKPPERQPRTQDYPPDSRNNSPGPQDSLSKRGDYPAKPVGESGDLQHFASNFVRVDQTGSVADERRFYADSVHFYGEGDLSWAGVAAATRRHHDEKQNRRYGVAAPATVKGPIDGGFYVVDQPVSWSRTDGSRVVRGRSILRLRVLPTGRAGWKITSIEEAGQ